MNDLSFAYHLQEKFRVVHLISTFYRLKNMHHGISNLFSSKIKLLSYIYSLPPQRTLTALFALYSHFAGKM